jgi:hypothetical protein
MILNIALILISVIYGILSITAGAVQLKKKEIESWASILMMLGGILIVISIFTKLLPMLIVSLLMIHISAISNGYKMYGKINLKHHIVRFILSVFIIVLFIYGI